MYNYEWDKKTRGYKLTTQNSKFVASEIRPVFAEELNLLGFDEHFEYDREGQTPLMWAKQNTFIYSGIEIGKAAVGEDNQLHFSVFPDTGIKKIQLVDIASMVEKNHNIMDSLVADTLKRIKEMYDEYKEKCEVVYIGFSGGKDSMVLLDLCHKVLPLTVPVVFSDTDMELPDTYITWDWARKHYEGRPFIKVRAENSALTNWDLFGPPSQNLRWCCAVHKSTPAILELRKIAKKTSANTLAFVGVRADESLKRSAYDDVGDGLKNQNQVNAMPILSWGTQELFLYIFEHDLFINPAYRKGLPRVGCLLCPMSSERQVILISKLYPASVSPFISQIKMSINRDFSSDEDFDKFIFSGGWHARQSGVTLKNVIASPSEKRSNNNLYYNFQPLKKAVFTEWLKTIGDTFFDDNPNNIFLRIADGTYHITIDGNDNSDEISVIDCSIEKAKNGKSLAKLIKSTINKALACVGCQACASECPTGALSFSNGIQINTDKCIHCQKCHTFQDGCMRFFSRRYAGGTTMNISGINKYMTFGLKREYVEVLSNETENFRATSALGNRMISSAVTWFREAKLISDSTAVKPTRLLDVGRNIGFDSEIFWCLIWIALVNNSPLFKWFICNTQIGDMTTIEKLNEVLETQVNSESVRKGALQSLVNTIKHSPIGTNIVQLEQKGVRVVSLKRISKSVEPLVVLYSLYLMANNADRTAFTLSEMMSGDFDSPFISPLIAFGMSADELKAQCMGISSVYPDFLSCSFSLGLDEIKVFPKKKTLDDVIGLILGE